MNGPNKTVGKFQRAFTDKAARPVSDFMGWLAAQAVAGVRFDSIEEAKAAFQKHIEVQKKSNPNP